MGKQTHQDTVTKLHGLVYHFREGGVNLKRSAKHPNLSLSRSHLIIKSKAHFHSGVPQGM